VTDDIGRSATTDASGRIGSAVTTDHLIRLDRYQLCRVK
jgi:hypothetical protein